MSPTPPADRSRKRLSGAPHRTVEALLIGMLCAVLGGLVGAVPAVLRLEESAGLSALFQLRGPRPAPEELVVVSLDKHSSDSFGLPNEPARWPRRLHAELIDRLAAAGAEVIAFDVRFTEPGKPVDDARLGQSAREAGNVVFAGFLKKRAVGTSRDGQVSITAETVVPPVAEIAEGAVAVAPFPLPVVPVKVSQFWTYKASSGGTPTFPTVIFQTWMLAGSGIAPDHWLTDLKRVCPALTIADDPAMVLHKRQVADLAWRARQCLYPAGAAAATVMAAWQQRLLEAPPPRDRLTQNGMRALFEVYTGSDSRYLNYYGPPRSIRTLPYAEALRGANPQVNGKIVLVGFSEQFQPEQKDGFHSVYSDDSGLDLSGVEIAATALGNLLDGTTIRPLGLGPQLLVVSFWGLLVGAFCRLLSPMTAVAFAVLSIPLYTSWALWVFTATNNWLPLVGPLAIQLPVGLLLGLLVQYRHAQSQRQLVLQALGSYLPAEAVDRLMHNLGDLQADAQLLHGTCLATDGEQYTRLAERLSPNELATLMNAYYEVLFAEVEQSGGVVTDVVGDAMMAIWATATPDSAMRARACRGALAIAAAVNRFNALPGRQPLPTRIGLHSGTIRLGNIGSSRHLEFRATGDIVNTASRVEGLNKLLGTRILVSADTITDVTGFETRELGTFLLPGKTTPLVIHELLGITGSVADELKRHHAGFAAALAWFRQGDWAGAAERFSQLQAARPDDQALQFYLTLCARYLAEGAVERADGVVKIVAK